MEGSTRLDVKLIQEHFGKDVLKVKEEFGDTFVCVNRAKIAEVLEFVRDHPALGYDYFSECLGVDYSTWGLPRDFDTRFEVVYNLSSLKHMSRLFFKVGVNDGESVPTCKHVFLGAEYPEREIADLYGIPFEGNMDHPGRFLLPDDWHGYPLRKEVPLGGEDVVFAEGSTGPAVEDISMPHAGESFDGKTGSKNTSGR